MRSLSGCPTRSLVTAVMLIGAAHPAPTRAQTPTASQPAAAVSEPEPESESIQETSKANDTRREPEVPSYVRPLSQAGIPGMEELDWFDFGLEQRTRFELRDDNYRRDLADDERFLLRTRGYFGVRNVLDPFRFAIEFQDSRQFGTELPELTRDADEADLLQAYAELYFEDALGPDRPFRFQAGRMSFDAVDRRLVARNRFRNTTNAFDGFRMQLGQYWNDWQIDFFAAQPVARTLLSFDHPDEERWFYGLHGAWRSWKNDITLEPYWFILDEDRTDRSDPDRELHTMGLHGFGPIADTRFDFDFNVAFQYGENGARDIRAFATHGEVGYSFEHDWKPRVAVSVDYASGDRTPDDSLDERFDSMFGASYTMYSYQNLWPWSNMIQPALWLTARPTDKMRVYATYRANWLASDTDSFIRASLTDPAGDSGSFVGQEIDLAVRYDFTRLFSLEVGYAHFIPGGFTRTVGGPAIDDADFFYVQTVLRF